MLNKGVQFRWPSGYDNFKNSIYDVYDKSTKDIGKAVEQKLIRLNMYTEIYSRLENQ